MGQLKKSLILEVDPEYGASFLDKDWLFFWDAPGSVEFLNKSNKNRQILKWELNGETFFVKKFFHFSVSEKFGVFNEWKQIYNLRRRGFNTLDPVAFGCDLEKGIGFLVTRKAPGYSLEKWATEEACKDFSEVVRASSSLVGNLHSQGFTHQDLYFSHLFWDERKKLVTLIDLQRVRRSEVNILNPLAIIHIIKDIAQLLYSASFFLNLFQYTRFKEIFWQEYSHYVPEYSNALVRRFVDLKMKKIANHDRKIKKKADKYE